VYDRMHTREIALYGGLTARMPWFAAIFLLFTMANVGLPGTSGFIGEILTMTGVYQVSTWTALVAASGVIFSAVYALTLYRNVMFGEITNPAMRTITDVGRRELLIFAPLIFGTLLLGVQPGLVLNYTDASVSALTSAYQLAIGG
jgi:NADH-quinone oxidoreductase subunit M